MKSAIKPTPIVEANRLEALRDIIIDKRKDAGAKAAYELYGVRFGRGAVKTQVICLDHAPTSGDFAPMIGKKRISWLADNNNMVVEFRGAWKSDEEAKVVCYESQQQADINAAK